MQYLLLILLLVVGCDTPNLNEYTPVYGCTAMNSCNFNPEANIFDGSCWYPDEFI